jgi:hypothetical protein
LAILRVSTHQKSNIKNIFSSMRLICVDNQYAPSVNTTMKHWAADFFRRPSIARISSSSKTRAVSPRLICDAHASVLHATVFVDADHVRDPSPVLSATSRQQNREN